ncbi:hypothetical protein SLS60_000263 [Paraconiothyrium brasiliense]|uniref:Uncharacterized protein n=1 Tax=Paraconiothyrium brasiliense TaxID=300254 RepID=A0ABR3S5Q6_9PLEO
MEAGMDTGAGVLNEGFAAVSPLVRPATTPETRPPTGLRGFCTLATLGAKGALGEGVATANKLDTPPTTADTTPPRGLRGSKPPSTFWTPLAGTTVGTDTDCTAGVESLTDELSPLGKARMLETAALTGFSAMLTAAMFRLLAGASIDAIGGTTIAGVCASALATAESRLLEAPADETGAKDEALPADAPGDVGLGAGPSSAPRMDDGPAERLRPTLKATFIPPAEDGTDAATADEARERVLETRDTGVTSVGALVDDELGNKLLTTPMGTKAMSPLVTPSVAPSVVPKPPTRLPTTPVTPFN